MAAPARSPLSCDDPAWSMPTEEQIETTIVEQRVLEHFETRHAGLMTMVFNAKWKDREGRQWKPPGPLLKLAIRNGGTNVKPAIASDTIAKIVVFECEKFARSKGCVVQFHIVLHGKGPDPDRDDDDDCDEPWRHQVNIRADGTRPEPEETEVANTPASSAVIDAPQPQLQQQAPAPAQPASSSPTQPTETGLVEGGSRAYGAAAADFLSNALARLEAKVDFQPGQVIGELRAVLQQQRLEHSAAALDNANVLREVVTTLVQLEVQRVATTDTVIRANTDSVMRIVNENNDNMRLVLGDLLQRDLRRDKKMDEALDRLRDSYKELAQAGRGETEASSKRAWAAFEEAMNMTRAAVRHEVRNEHLEAELARRDQAPPPAIAKSGRSWASPFMDKIIEAFPMVALMAGSAFAQKGWTQGATAAIGFFQKLTGQEFQMDEMSPEGGDEQPQPEQQPQQHSGPVHPPQPSTAGPQHVTPRNGAPHPGSNGAASPSNGTPTNGATVHAEAQRPTAPPQRPRRAANPLVENLRRLRGSLSAEQIGDLQQVIPPTAWAGFETAAAAELDNVAMAALIPLGTSAQQDPTIEKHVVGLLDTEQAKLFGVITSHLKQAFGLTKPTAPPSRPQRAST